MFPLTGAEGHDLVYPLVERIAVHAGLRTLACSAAVARAQGITTPDVESAAVEVWSDPVTLGALVAALGQHGWVPGPDDSFTHAEWSVDVVLVDRHPALEADPQDVFDALWATRDYVRLAGVAVSCCSPVWSFLFAGAATESEGDWAVLIADAERLLDADQASELTAYASSTGLADKLEPILSALAQASLR